MLKCVLFLLSEYYYEIVLKRLDEICESLRPGQVRVRINKTAAGFTDQDMHAYPADKMETGCSREEMLVVTDQSQAAQLLLDEGWYVAALYHEGNRQESFPKVKYGLGDLFEMEYRAYDAAYRRLAGLPLDILETRRLKVREGTVEDVEAYYEIYSDPSITLYMENLYEDKEVERDYMRAYIDRIYGFYGYGLWSVILKETGRVIGRAGLSVRQGYELPELGFVIDVRYQKKGYGLEVCRAILAYAKKELVFEKVQALVDKDNLISKRLLGKLGFVFDRRVCVKEHGYELFIKKL